MSKARAQLAIKRARLSLLKAQLLPGEQPDPDAPRMIAVLEEEIRELQLAAGETIRLPYRDDIDR
jgi:hypothetical protein